MYFAASGFFAKSAFAQGACKKINPSTSYDSKIRNVEYIRTESVEGLTEWQSTHGILGTKVLGVGGGKLGTQLTVRYEISEIGEDLYCLYPKQIRAEFYAAPQIHIASNFPRGSCEYSEVLVHEQKHITELRKFYREHRSPYAKEFSRIAREIPVPEPVPLTEVEAKKKEITGFILSGLNDYTQIMMDELNARQKEIDTPDEYKRVIAKCDNWDKKVSRSH